LADILADNKEDRYNLIRKILMTALVMIMLVTAGCDEQKPPTEPETPKQITQPEPAKNPPSPEVKPEPETHIEKKPTKVEGSGKILQVKVYYPDDSGINLVGVNRQIKISKVADKYFAAVKLLTEEPTEKDLTKIFPSHARINGVMVKGKTAYVNFDGSITENFVGGSTGEELLINSFVNTLTEFPEIEQVKFLINGKDVETLAGHMDLSMPLKRTEE